MIDQVFAGIFDSDLISVISVTDFLLCILISIIIGILFSIAYTYRSRYTKSFVMTLAMLPAIVCIVIMMVNGNVGTGVAVAGAFSLVRFRSVPGSAKEIAMIFLAMSAGLIAGMGYLGYAMLFTVIMSLVYAVYNQCHFGLQKQALQYKTLNITIPEDLDYTQIFDDVFAKYATNVEMMRVKTTNMGSLFRVTYNLTLKDVTKEKEMIDELRCRNGNLEITMSRQETTSSEL